MKIVSITPVFSRSTEEEKHGTRLSPDATYGVEQFHLNASHASCVGAGFIRVHVSLGCRLGVTLILRLSQDAALFFL